MTSLSVPPRPLGSANDFNTYNGYAPRPLTCTRPLSNLPKLQPGAHFDNGIIPLWLHKAFFEACGTACDSRSCYSPRVDLLG
jgi:hypothetical protein